MNIKETEKNIIELWICLEKQYPNRVERTKQVKAKLNKWGLK